ncbi:hypothetical protein ASE39_21740 [Acidovorax sp. Root267]|uniref:hypothetical protein n=1 Tax=Acidovorax sp. Root267 TaxID=1736505 RepID=UPI00070D6725|nr:hypothetical protein [Acidovorax sp. Root267]KRD25635.1 hypothetical protein ASE39_21740 [Acidovorax sp. Root267]
MDRESIIKAVGLETAKASPPVAVVAHQAANGWTMSHTLTALTILYVGVQLAYLLWKWRNERAERNAKRAAYGVEP